MKDVDLDLIVRAATVFNGFDGPDCDELWWRTGGEYAPITLLVGCNDFFAWGCSDCEEITKQNIDVLEQAADDLKKVCSDRHGPTYREAGLLFCARVRGRRPQGAYYEHLPKETWPLFDACGEPRATGVGNPKPRPEESAP